MLAKLRRRLKSQKGFTLIELLAVVTIIAVLAAFAVPKVMQAISNSKSRTGQADMTTIGAALDQYFMDWNNYPTKLSDLVDKKYLKPTTAFKNPYGQGYFYAVDSTQNPQAYLLADPGPNGNGTGPMANPPNTPVLYHCMYNATSDGQCGAAGTAYFAPKGQAPNATAIAFSGITFMDNAKTTAVPATVSDPSTWFNTFRTDVVTQ